MPPRDRPLLPGSGEGDSLAARLKQVARRARKSLTRTGPDSAEALSTDLLDALPDPFLIVGADDGIRLVNSAVQTVLGYESPSLLERPLAESLIPESDRAAYRDHLGQLSGATEGGAHSQTVPSRIRLSDRSERAVTLAIHRVEGRALFGVTVRLVEPPRPNPGPAAPTGREGMFRTIVDAIPDRVVAVDLAGRVVFRNQASVTALKQDPTAGGDGAPAELLLAPLPFEERVCADEAMRRGEVITQQGEADASGVICQTTRIPVRDRTGTVAGLVAIARDVTAQKADEARLLSDKRTAEAAAQAHSEFLATTSHEIRTLMSGVTGMTALLLGTSLDEEQRDYVETVRTSSAALLTIVNDVLDLSKMEAGRLQLEDRPFSVRRVIKDALSMVSQQGAARRLDLSCEVDEFTPYAVRGDATRLKQVLVNLLSNAIKFTNEGSVKVVVGSATWDSENRLTLPVAVDDTGVGIEPERLGAIFEPFAQAHASTARTHGGTGLGLPICRRLVDMMGGELTATSVPGVGSRFSFSISVTLSEEAELEEEIPMLDLGMQQSPNGFPSTVPTGPAAPEARVATRVATGTDRSASPPTSLRVEAPSFEPIPEQAPAEQTPPAEPAPAAPIPVAPPETVEVAASPVAPRTTAPRADLVLSVDAILPSSRVLLVEDNPTMQKVTSLTLRRLGYRPDVVGNGKLAVEAVRREAYDVVLMDVMMPVMNGLDATRAIRADPGRHPMPAIVALTANAMMGDRKLCLDAGCDAYLSKPVEPRHLASAIEHTMRKRKSTAEVEECAPE